MVSALLFVVYATLSQQVNAYTEKFHLPARVVKVTTPGVKATRTFVPIVTESQRADFVERFSRKNHAILWAQSADTNYYASLDFDRDTRYFRNGGAYNAQRMFVPAPWRVTKDPREAELAGRIGRYLALEIEPAHIAALEHHFATLDTAAKWKAANPGKQIQAAGAGCMWWLSHAEVANHRSLWHLLGVRRSAAPENLFKKLMHAGNERVSTVGVVVPSLEAFAKMTDAELMGQKPAGGEIDAVKTPE